MTILSSHVRTKLLALRRWAEATSAEGAGIMNKKRFDFKHYLYNRTSVLPVAPPNKCLHCLCLVRVSVSIMRLQAMQCRAYAYYFTVVSLFSVVFQAKPSWLSGTRWMRYFACPAHGKHYVYYSTNVERAFCPTSPAGTWVGGLRAAWLCVHAASPGQRWVS